jgi:hypothetical protein
MLLFVVSQDLGAAPIVSTVYSLCNDERIQNVVAGNGLGGRIQNVVADDDDDVIT